jgi:alanine racemase
LAKQPIENYPIHLKFDTGMHRLGFNPGEAAAVVKLIRKNKQIELRSVFSHLFSSEASNRSLSEAQIALFEEIRAYFNTHWPKPVLFHILNSAGISRFPEASMDMVRLGVGLYGLSGDPLFAKQLLPVIAWSTVISQIKEVARGETVGYGGIFKVQRDMRIAVLPVGYADGISRQLGNGKGRVNIHGVDCPFVGNICMDMSMVNITGLDCKAGDSVELIGPHLSIEDLAKARETIGYEVLTSIPPRVKRSYIFEG